MKVWKEYMFFLLFVSLVCNVLSDKPSTPSPSPMSNGVCTYNKNTAPCLVDCTCFDFQLISVTTSANQTVMVWEVADNCKWEVSYIAFGSAGLSIASPKDGSTYVGLHSTYTVVYTTMSGNPGFQSVKFQVSTPKDYAYGAKERFTIILNQPLPCNYKFSLQGHAAQVYDTFSGYSIDDCLNSQGNGCSAGYGGSNCSSCANPSDTPGWTYWCMPVGTTPMETYVLTLQNCDPSKNNCPSGGFSPYLSTTSPGGYQVDCLCNQVQVPCPNNCYGNGICYYQNGTCGCNAGVPPYCAVPSPSATPSRTPSATPSQTPSSSPSASPSPSSSSSPSSSASATPSRSPSSSASVTPTSSPSVTPSTSPSSSPSVTPSASSSTSPSVTPSSSATSSPSVTPSVSPSVTPSNTPSRTPSTTPTSSVTPSPSVTPSRTASPSASPSNAPSGPPSVTPTSSPSMSSTPSPSGTPSVTPSSSATSSPSVTPSSSVTPSPTSSVTPTSSPSVTPSTSATSSPSSTPSSSVTPTPSGTPSSTPSSTPSVTPSVTPSETPSPSVSATPSTSSTPSISVSPSVSTTPSPSADPTPSVTPSPVPEVLPCEVYDFCSGRGLCEGDSCNCTSGYTGMNCSDVPPVFTCTQYTDCSSCMQSSLNCSWCIGDHGNSMCTAAAMCAEGNTTVSCNPTTVNYQPEPCPNGCSGHGRCDDGKCHCDAGWTSNDCGTFDSVTVGAAVGGAVIGLIVMGAVVFALLAGGGAAYYKYSQMEPSKTDPVQDNPIYEGNEPQENPLYESSEDIELK